MTIASCMTPAPVTIRCGQSLAEALELMRDRHVRHLPVVDRGRIVGLLSDEDALRLMANKKAVDPEVLTTCQAMSPEPLVVGPDEPVGEVARGMAERGVGSAIVMEGTTLLGVFTTTDALRLLADCDL
jgi:acetoin utilization protein AcuB